jgi:hypothetical protein
MRLADDRGGWDGGASSAWVLVLDRHRARVRAVRYLSCASPGDIQLCHRDGGTTLLLACMSLSSTPASLAKISRGRTHVIANSNTVPTRINASIPTTLDPRCASAFAMPPAPIIATLFRDRDRGAF